MPISDNDYKAALSTPGVWILVGQLVSSTVRAWEPPEGYVFMVKQQGGHLWLKAIKEAQDAKQGE